MTPEEYMTQFYKEGADIFALTKVIIGMYGEKRAEVMGQNRKMTAQDLDAVESSFQTFRRYAEDLPGSGNIPTEIFRLVVQKKMPGNFKMWNETHNGQLLAK